MTREQQKINRLVTLIICFIINLVVMFKENMFKSVPSTTPIKSPSPDSKRANNITPTKSPEKYINITLAHNNVPQPFYRKNYSSHNYENPNTYEKNLNAINFARVPQGRNQINFSSHSRDINANASNQVNPVSSSRVQQQRTHSPKAFNISFSCQGQITNLSDALINDSVFKSPKNFVPQTTHSMQSNQKSDQYKKYNRESYKNYDNSSFKEYNRINGSQQGVSAFRHFQQTIREKDQTIAELRNILTIISQSQSKQSTGKLELEREREMERERERNQRNQQTWKQMQQQNHVLTIENQKLLAIIDRLSSRQNESDRAIFNRPKQQKNQQLEELTKQILQLQQNIVANRLSHQKEMDSLLKSHKSLASHCNDIEKNYRNIQQQNKRLLKLLQQKDTSERKLFQQKRQSQFSVKSDNLADKEKDKGQKLTIAKIKEQYNENLRLFKQSVYDQVDEMYNTIQQTIEQTNERLINSQKRVKQLQSKLQQLGNSAVNVQKQIKNNKKSQIYIEDAPSSSSDREAHNKSVRSDEEQQQQSRQDDLGQDELGAKLSSIVEQSRDKQVEQLKEQLERVSYELSELRFKYEKMSLDSETTPYSKRSFNENFNLRLSKQNQDQLKSIQLADLKQKYEELSNLHQSLKKTMSNEFGAQTKANIIVEHESLQQRIEEYQEYIAALKNDLQNKDKQLEKMMNEVDNKDQQIQKILNDLSNKEKQVQRLANDLENKEKQIEKYQQETQQKVKLVIDSFEKQIGILKQEIINKNIRQNQLKQQIGMLNRKISDKQVAQHQIEREMGKLALKLTEGKQSMQKLLFDLNYNKQQLRIKESELTMMKHQLAQANERIEAGQSKTLQISNELEAANYKLSKLKSEGMLQQLKQVKRLVNPEQLFKLEQQFTELSDLYNRNLTQYQQKVKESEIVHQRNADLAEKALKNQENTIALREKITLLETTISVYQSQLKNRKELYENLIQRKSTTQLETQKLKRQRDQANKQKFIVMKESSRIVNEKIDFILGMQTQREKEIQQLIKSFGIISHRSNKITQPIERQIQPSVENFSLK